MIVLALAILVWPELLAYLVARATGHTAGLPEEAGDAQRAAKGRGADPVAGAAVPGVRDVYVAIGLSGMTALGAEVIVRRVSTSMLRSAEGSEMSPSVLRNPVARSS